MRLDEDGRLLRIESGGEPVEDHLENIVLHPRGVRVIGGEGVPVGGEEKTLVVVLQPDPVLQSAHVVANVQLAGRSHAAQYTAIRSLFCFFRHPFLSRGILRISARGHRRPRLGTRHLRRSAGEALQHARNLNVTTATLHGRRGGAVAETLRTRRRAHPTSANRRQMWATHRHRLAVSALDDGDLVGPNCRRVNAVV